MASRMAREAQATATLGHPAIVRVFDHGTTAFGDPFLVMELVEGETLADHLNREGKLNVVAAVQLLLPVLDGLRCAHERGVIHRDIKPENVLIARDPLGRHQPKLLDFGIAKLEHQPAVSRLTQVGDVLGSPEFMSPEQARGVPDIDARTDVWSVSVVLYELVTGMLPFKIKNYNALMQAILHEQPVPTVDRGVGDKNLWRVIVKGLAKSRDRRWPSMAALGEALAFWLYDQGVTEDVCGNSLRTVWLGGTTAGQSMRPPTDSWLDQSAPAIEHAAEERAMPTLKLRFRRVRRDREPVCLL
jgi:serine/threonine-protein kinase